MYHAFQDKSKLYFILEYLPGGEFADYLRIHSKNKETTHHQPTIIYVFRKTKQRSGSFLCSRNCFDFRVLAFERNCPQRFKSILK